MIPGGIHWQLEAHQAPLAGVIPVPPTASCVLKSLPSLFGSCAWLLSEVASTVRSSHESCFPEWLCAPSWWWWVGRDGQHCHHHPSPEYLSSLKVHSGSVLSNALLRWCLPTHIAGMLATYWSRQARRECWGREE